MRFCIQPSPKEGLIYLEYTQLIQCYIHLKRGVQREGGGRGGERERERDRQTDRQTDGRTDGQRDRQTDRQTDRDRDRDRERLHGACTK